MKTAAVGYCQKERSVSQNGWLSLESPSSNPAFSASRASCSHTNDWHWSMGETKAVYGLTCACFPPFAGKAALSSRWSTPPSSPYVISGPRCTGWLKCPTPDCSRLFSLKALQREKRPLGLCGSFIQQELFKHLLSKQSFLWFPTRAFLAGNLLVI